MLFGMRLEAARRYRSTASLKLTPELIDRCAQRLASWQDDSVWPDSWSPDQVRQMRRDAEKVLREAGFDDAPEKDPPPHG